MLSRLLGWRFLFFGFFKIIFMKTQSSEIRLLASSGIRGLKLIELLYNIFKIEYNSWEKNSTEEVWNRNRFLVCENYH